MEVIGNVLRFFQGDPSRQDLRAELVEAFRRITMTLALIPEASRPSFPPIDNLANEDKLWSSTLREELRISDAFAHLLVAEHEVVAVASNYSSSLSACKDTNPHLSIVACISTQNDIETQGFQVEEEENTVPKNYIAKFFWKLLISKNPETKGSTEQESRATPPTPDLENAIPARILEYVESMLTDQWYVPSQTAPSTAFSHFVDRQQPSLEVHSWILSQMLTAIGLRDSDHPKAAELLSQSFDRTLQRYIILYSHKKTLNRAKHPKSVIILQALKELQEIPFNSSLLKSYNVKPKYATRQILNDWQISKALTILLDDGFLAQKIQIPKLEAQVRLFSAASEQSTLKLYTPSTCREFHRLLCFLLAAFFDSLNRLASHIDGDSILSKADFQQTLADAVIWTNILTLLARSRVLEMHIINIQPLLSAYIDELETQESNTPTSMANKVSAAQVDGQDGQDECEQADLQDDEMDAIALALVKGYVNWFQLIIAVLDALQIIVQFVKSPRFILSGISVKLLFASSPNRNAMKWSKLFQDGRFFPRENTPAETAANKPVRTNNQLAQFFLYRASKAHQDKLFCEVALSILANWPTKKVARNNLLNTNLMKSVAENKAIGIAQGHPLVNHVSALLKGENAPWTTASESEAKEIVQQLLQTCSKQRLNNENFYLQFLDNAQFRGTVHSESFLASSLRHFTEYRTNAYSNTNLNLAELQAECYGRVIGVSKRCCPVCFLFLDILIRYGTSAKSADVAAALFANKELFPPDSLIAVEANTQHTSANATGNIAVFSVTQLPAYLVRARHSTISSCTLPPGVPNEVLLKMIAVLGGVLRQVMVNIMEEADRDYLKYRRGSYDSASLSIYSASEGGTYNAMHVFDSRQKHSHPGNPSEAGDVPLA